MNINFDKKNLNAIVEQFNNVSERIEHYDFHEAIQNYNSDLSVVFTQEYLDEAPENSKKVEASVVWDLFCDSILGGDYSDKVVVIDRQKFVDLCESSANFKREKEEKELQDYDDCINDFHQALKNIVAKYEDMIVRTRDNHHFYISDCNNVSLEVRIKDHSYRSGAGKAYGFSCPDVEFVFKDKERYYNNKHYTINEVEQFIERSL